MTLTKNSAIQLPLVSVLCRSMNRPELIEALQSVEKQTYPNIEIVLVDASGAGLSVHKAMALATPVVNATRTRQLNRPAAANLALEYAKGEYCVFLDEDDWISPEHIETLVKAFADNPSIGVAYSSTQKAHSNGELYNDIFAIDFDIAKLRRDNFIPIHSALFLRSLYSSGCKFDIGLDIFEDWDFWLQASQKTNFVHINVISAFYRDGGESNTATSNPANRFLAGNSISLGRALLFNKWFSLWDGQQINETLGTLDTSERVQQLECQAQELGLQAQELNTKLVSANEGIQNLNEEIATLGKEIHDRDRKLSTLNQNFQRKSAELEEAKSHINLLTAHIQTIYDSLSWRLTKPVRGLKKLLIILGAGKAKARIRDLQKRAIQQSSHTNKNIKFGLDTPTVEQKSFFEQVTLQGWCTSPSGICKIEVLIDGKVSTQFGTGVTRSDIANAFPNIENAISSGFHHELLLGAIPAGAHQLEVRITDNSGETCSEIRPFNLLKNADLYNTWYWRNAADKNDVIKRLPHVDSTTKALRFHVIISDLKNDAIASTLASLAEQSWDHLHIRLIGAAKAELSNITAPLINVSATITAHNNIQEAIEQITDPQEWAVFLSAGETLAPNALLEFAQAATNRETELVYSDHDQYNPDGEHSLAVFTPEWSPEHLYASNYIGQVYCIKRASLTDLALQAASDLDWRYSLLLSLSDTISQPQRVAKVLWSSPQKSKKQQDQAEFKSVANWLAAYSPEALVSTNDNGIRHIQWPLTVAPKVSIIIPTMGKLSLVEPCIESLLSKTSYSNFEVIILDNGRGGYPEGIAYLRDKGLKVIECHYPFNWAKLNNVGVQHASGELYLFLNDDVEIIHESWLEEMVRLALRPTTGTVGALLLYPNGALQHSGVMLVNRGGGCLHLLHKRMPSNQIYRNLHETTREVSANTGACLMVSRENFEKADGFDEKLAIVGNDIDLCLRLAGDGYSNIWTPHCRLIHHESISRKTNVPKEDEASMWERWGKAFHSGDRFYNPNLSAERGDFSLDADSFLTPKGIATPAPETASSEGKFDIGVNLIGYTRAEMGVGEGARSDAKALQAANEPFGIVCFQAGNPSRMTDLSWQHKEVDSAPFDVTLLHINPDQAMNAISALPSSFFDKHYVIGYWAWELPEIPMEWESAFIHFDEIWVPSSFVQDAVALKSPIPVLRIPHAIEVSSDDRFSREDFGLPEDTFIFFSMFDTHSLAERKNPTGVIRAFKQAFDANDTRVRLVLKLNNGTADAMLTLSRLIGDYRNITLLDKVYGRVELNSLIDCVDCLVSLHRSEGFGLGPAEAMALGKVVIATNWSGNCDYMRADNCIGVAYKLVTIQEDCGPYKKGQVWAEPDIEEAASGMRRLLDDKELAQSLGEKAKETIENEFSPRVVGQLMRARLAQIRGFTNKH
jgi:GT2 family glycosyltransferase/glycosyltransferase involved in cell wall biosynthesis